MLHERNHFSSLLFSVYAFAYYTYTAHRASRVEPNSEHRRPIPRDCKDERATV